jgi:hypothetical protein
VASIVRPGSVVARGAVLGLCLAIFACSSEGKPQSEEEKNLQALSVFYGRFMSQHRGMGPTSEDEFKKFVKARTPAELESFGVTPDQVDQVFVSPRDHAPYGIALKVASGVPKPDGSAAMILWEQTGVNGKRYVADAIGRIEEIDEATFQQRLAAIPKAK